MKKVLFSVLMFSAMFMIASCGSKTNSGEATEEEGAKVEFADPAIVYGEGVDLTSYFSPVSVSQPTIYEDKSSGNYYHRLSVNVKLKVNKKPNLKGTHSMAEAYPTVWGPKVGFIVKFCDEGGSTIAEGNDWKQPEAISEGSTFSLDIKSDDKDILKEDAESKLAKVKKIEVCISTANAELVNDEE